MNLIGYVVRSLSPEALAREDAEALSQVMTLSDWIDLRACGLRPAPEYVVYVLAVGR